MKGEHYNFKLNEYCCECVTSLLFSSVLKLNFVKILYLWLFIYCIRSFFVNFMIM